MPAAAVAESAKYIDGMVPERPSLISRQQLCGKPHGQPGGFGMGIPKATSTERVA